MDPVAVVELPFSSLSFLEVCGDEEDGLGNNPDDHTIPTLYLVATKCILCTAIPTLINSSYSGTCSLSCRFIHIAMT